MCYFKHFAFSLSSLLFISTLLPLLCLPSETVVCVLWGKGRQEELPPKQSGTRRQILMCSFTCFEWCWVAWTPRANGHLSRDETWTPVPDLHVCGLASSTLWGKQSPQQAAHGLQSVQQHAVPRVRMHWERCYLQCTVEVLWAPGSVKATMKPFLRIL